MTLGRRDVDPRPPVELWGEEPGIQSTERVTMGHRAAAAPGGPRRRALAAFVLVGGLLLGGLALSDRDNGASPGREERDNRDRAALKTTTTGSPSESLPSVTSTTVPIARGPVFGEPVGASLLLVMGGSARRTLLDLDTGVLVEVRIEAEFPDAVPVRGGVVVVRKRTAELIRLPHGDALAAPDGERGHLVVPEPVALGVANRVMSSGSPDTVWLVRGPDEEGGEPGVTGQLVDLSGQPVGAPVHAPTSFPFGATPEGLVFGIGGRVYLAGPQGTRPVAVGEVLDIEGTRIALLTCDSAAVCSPEVIDLSSPASVRLPSIRNPRELGASFTLSESGDAAIVQHEAGGSLSVVDAHGQVIGSIRGLDLDLDLRSDPAWLPDDLGLVLAVRSGFVRVVPGAGVLEVFPLPLLDSRRADVIYVIPH